MTAQKDWQAHLADIAVEAERLAGERNPAAVAELATRAFGCGLWAALTPEVVAASCKASVQLGTPVLCGDPLRALIATEAMLDRAGALGWAPKPVKPPDLVAVPPPEDGAVEPSPVAKQQRRTSFPTGRPRWADRTAPPEAAGEGAVTTRALAEELRIATRLIHARIEALGITVFAGIERARWVSAEDAARVREAIEAGNDPKHFRPLGMTEGALTTGQLETALGASRRTLAHALAELKIEPVPGRYRGRWVGAEDVDRVRQLLADQGSGSRAPASLGDDAVLLQALARQLDLPSITPLASLLSRLGVEPVPVGRQRWISSTDADRLRALIDPATELVGDQTGLVAEPVGDGLGSDQPEG